jgi:hypothetical protein
MTRRREFTDFTAWGEAAHARGLWCFGTATKSEARKFRGLDNPDVAFGSVEGEWIYGTDKGWLNDDDEAPATGTAPNAGR